MVIFICKTLLIGHLGSVSGFIYHHYNSSKYKPADTAFVKMYGIHLFIVGLIALFFGIFFGKLYIFGAIAFIILIPLNVLEPIMRIKNKFIVSLFPDIACSLSMVLTTLIIKRPNYNPNLNLEEILLIFLICLISCYFLFLKFFWGKKFFCYKFFIKLKNAQINWKCYKRNLNSGFLIFLGTLGFFLFLSVDRVFLNHFHSLKDQGNYFLAYQLASGSCLLISAQNLVSGIKIGEAHKTGKASYETLKNQLLYGIYFAFAGYITIIFLTFFLGKFFLNSSKEFFITTVFLGLGLCIFYISSNINSYAFFKQRQKKITLAMLFIAILSIVYNIIILKFKLPTIFIPICNSVLLISYSIFSIKFCINILNTKKNGENN